MTQATSNMKYLLSRFLLVLPLGASAIALAAPAKCPIAGEVDEWATDFCLFAAATDDLIHPDVVACLKKQSEVRAGNTCLVKKKYKAKICGIVVQGHSYPGSVKQCLKDASFSGPIVRNGER